jgi:hypothetical protein
MKATYLASPWSQARVPRGPSPAISASSAASRGRGCHFGSGRFWLRSVVDATGIHACNPLEARARKDSRLGRHVCAAALTVKTKVRNSSKVRILAKTLATGQALCGRARGAGSRNLPVQPRQPLNITRSQATDTTLSDRIIFLEGLVGASSLYVAEIAYAYCCAEQTRQALSSLCYEQGEYHSTSRQGNC